MTRAELDVLTGWAADEGWNPGIDDAEVFWHTDPTGFLAAELDGEFVAGGSLVAYGRTYGFMGLFIIRSDVRHAGLGGQLWQLRGMMADRLAPGASIGIEGVVAMQDFYARGGFALVARDVRHVFTAQPADLDHRVIAAADVPFAEVLAFDSAHFPAPRPEFLRGWLAMPHATALVAKDGDRLTGFGVIRKCRDGHKVGPLFAETPRSAEVLLQSLAGRAAGEQVFIDVPGDNPAAQDLAARWGMTTVFECGRMYSGPVPDLPLTEIYGITTFELG
ncbi:MAG: GNAT family N-acetyltransferase [Actinomycetes bacterium]